MENVAEKHAELNYKFYRAKTTHPRGLEIFLSKKEVRRGK